MNAWLARLIVADVLLGCLGLVLAGLDTLGREIR